MNNSIINDNSFKQKEEIYQQFILKIIDEHKENNYISINGKILHYLPEPTFCYYIKVYKNTIINPFCKTILFCFEFINGEIPYVTILSDFGEPLRNDNRNYYRCLTKEHDYIFSLNKYVVMENIIKSMILGIKKFLKLVNESIEINYFVYFGEYELNHTYQVNDFLQNNTNFYRIYDIKDNQQKEKFILFTNLYFIIFQPFEFDKSLMTIEFILELNEINLIFDKNEENHSLILNLSKTKYKRDLEFVLIDRKHLTKKEKNNFNFGQEKNDIEYDYSTLIQKWFTHQNNNIILFKKYNSIIKNYTELFDENRDQLEIKVGKKWNVEDYNKLIVFYENILEYYETKKEKINENNERMHEIIANLVYLCSELVNYEKNTKNKDNKYLKKMKKYLEYYK